MEDTESVRRSVTVTLSVCYLFVLFSQLVSYLYYTKLYYYSLLFRRTLPLPYPPLLVKYRSPVPPVSVSLKQWFCGPQNRFKTTNCGSFG